MTPSYHFIPQGPVPQKQRDKPGDVHLLLAALEECRSHVQAQPPMRNVASRRGRMLWIHCVRWRRAGTRQPEQE